MSTDRWSKVLQAALDTMGIESDSLGPLPLIATLLQAFKNRHIDAATEDAERLAEALLPDDPNEPLALKWGETLRHWDHLETGEWTRGTERHSRERRDLIYQLLGMPTAWTERCEVKHVPRLASFEAVPVIGDEWTPWYDQSRRELRRFFWSHYQDYLLNTQHWPEESVQNLDRDSSVIVGRLTDPESPAAHAVRGLVVGYVQSGKTANFTAVIAKAADAGYRLIIVLAGTLDVLRNQTQRRLDKELIGRELIEHRLNDDGGHDYLEDAEWDDFVRHGGLPQHHGGFDWQRLTTATFDYQSLKAGIKALEFTQAIPGRPYNDPANLHRDTARLLVIKKSPRILRKVIQDLKRLKTVLATVPTLIIDDESDLASVNTLPPGVDKEQKKKRTATNARIIELLLLLPRSAYVGYTATPAATVLMDDKDELFPRDFIIPLPKPEGYMGVSDFIDPDGCPEHQRYRERAYVRSVEGDDNENANLPHAVDCFVLAGCIKLHRETAHGLKFKHHTMLVHRSHRMTEHEKDRALVMGLLDRKRFVSASGTKRLQSLLIKDFLPVRELLDKARGKSEVETLPKPEELTVLLQQFFDERLHPDRVLKVNGDTEHETSAPDFDKGPIWAILVGGTKLSRGYTIEGLTTSYYRRTTQSSDTLMQMGRWFGYRRNYQDLVRVFLGKEQHKKNQILDLHEEFRACCLDEEEFRAELAKYASDGDIPLRPKDVPPLVYNSGLLPPTAANKMRYARRAISNFGGGQKEPTLAPTSKSDIAANWKALELLCPKGSLHEVELSLPGHAEHPEFPALIGRFENAQVLTFLRSYRWSRAGAFRDMLEYLEGTKGDPGVKDWCVMLPQLIRSKKHATHRFSGYATHVHERARIGDGKRRYKVYSSPTHAIVAKWMAGNIDDVKASAVTTPWREKGRAVLALYAVKAKDEDTTNLGFFCSFPSNTLPWKVTFVTNSEDA